MKTENYRHLTLEKRIEIQECLSHGMSFKDIGKRIGKNQTTVSREVKRHILVKPTTVVRKDKDGTVISEPCKFLLTAPFVCNACKHRHRSCAFDKHIYSAKDAQNAYESDLRTSREGIPLSNESFYENDRIITEGIRSGQHLYHIAQTHHLNVSISTLYRHLKKGYLSVSAIEFPRVVKFKPRAQPYTVYVPKASKVGRTFADFLLLKAETDCTAWVEMDTVIGRVGGKVILTFDFTFCNFMFGILLPDKTASSVSCAILALKKLLHQHGIPFGLLFPILLTDNGGEFSDVATIENDLFGNKETSLFFCDPSQSSQKPHVEKNHTLFRDIVPQGSSFDDFTQDTVNLIFSHINCVKRKSIYGKTPYQLFAFAFSDDLPSVLGMDDVPAELVVQSPLLLKIKH